MLPKFSGCEEEEEVAAAVNMSAERRHQFESRESLRNFIPGRRPIRECDGDDAIPSGWKRPRGKELMCGLQNKRIKVKIILKIKIKKELKLFKMVSHFIM